MAFSPPTDPRSIAGLRQLMAQLRAPEGGCPWDLDQTHATIAPYCIEEAYEVVDAIEHGTDDTLKYELGDLLLQVVFHAQMAEERGAFTFDDVCEAIVTKMVRRHPHVFDSPDGRDAEDQTLAWEDMKAAERAEKGEAESLMDGVPVGLPALTRAQKLSKRAARIGFDWPGALEAMDKVREETGELEEALKAGDEQGAEGELGDLLHTVANVARLMDADAETALRGSNDKFVRRFRAVEAGISESGKPAEDHSLDELEGYWAAAKALENKSG